MLQVVSILPLKQPVTVSLAAEIVVKQPAHNMTVALGECIPSGSTSKVLPKLAPMHNLAIVTNHDGVFFRTDLETLEVVDRLYLGGNVLMGSFIWNGDGVNM